MTTSQLEGFYLSPQQRRAWRRAHHTRHAGAVQVVVRLDGALDTKALRRAVERVVGRHEVLSSIFEGLSGMAFPLQVPGTAGASGTVVWRELAAGDCDALDGREVDFLLAEERGAPWDLAHGPMVKAVLRHGAAADALLIMTLPGLCADGISVTLLVIEIAAAYEGRPAPAEAVRYVQFAEWHNAVVGEGTGQEGGEVPSAVALTRLPFARPPAGAVDEHGIIPAWKRRCAAPELAQQTRALAAKWHRQTRDVLWAVSYLVLAGYSGEGTVVAAVADEGRPHDALADAIGPFARWIPLALELDGRRTLAAVASRLAERWEASGTWRDTFVWAEDAWPRVGLRHLHASSPEPASGMRFHLERCCADFDRADLVLDWQEIDDRIVLELVYDPRRFDAADVERLGDQCLELWRRAVAEPDLRLTAAHLGWPAPVSVPRAVPEERMWVHQRFAAHAAHRPQVPALVCDERQMSYGELAGAVRLLARRLRTVGVRRGDLVGLLAERSPELVAGLLAVLEVGAAFVPLDPSQPRRRLAMMIEDVAAPVLLTQRRLMPGLDGLPGRLIALDLEEEPPLEDDGTRARVAPCLLGHDTAYVMFTSGSTGRPKGVVVGHAQLASYVDDVLERLDLPPGSSFATVSTFAADLGNTAIFGALTSGGCLHVITEERAADAAAMAAYMTLHGVDCLKIVPSHLEALMEHPEPCALLPRQRLVVGGESSRRGWLEGVQRLAPTLRVVNHYGPTETTVGVLTHRLRPEGEDPRCATVPLGRPLASSSVYVLDPLLRPVPAWIGGEIFIGGGGVSQGYLGRPLQTAERFLPDPFSAVPGARFYGTGDQGRILSDGTLEFLGRLDNQVKFHGFRIELAEIEAALELHPQVRQSVVRLLHDEDAGEVLAAYYLSRQSLEVTELREHLAKYILEETIPNVFAHLRRLPLTLNGKINYAALPSVGEIRRLSRTYTAPRTTLEGKIAEIWREVLKVERVGVHDNFFALGGHSLLATRILSRQRETFQIEMPLRALFEQPTVAELAVLVENQLSLAPATAPDGPLAEAVGFEDQLAAIEELDDSEVEARLVAEVPALRVDCGETR